MYKQKTQTYIRIENIGIAYFDSIGINNPEQWQGRLPEYLIEREKYDRWVTMYGTGKHINVVFHNDYFSGRNLVALAHHLLNMSTKLGHTSMVINPFLMTNWTFGSRNLPGSCIYNEPESAIQFLHAYVSGMFSSSLYEFCYAGMPVFDLMNKEIYADSEGAAGIINRFDELDNNDGILFVDFTSSKYCFMMTDTFDPSTARIQLEKFTPVPAIDYLRAFHPEHETTMEQHRINEKIQNWKLNPIFISAMDPFQVLSKEEIEEWFPGMINMIPVAARLKSKGRKTPAVFEDAQAMAKAFPDTFQAPSQYLLNRITVGSQLKVCVRTPKHILVQRAKAGLPEVISERFRVIVTAVDGNKITGVIDHIVQFIEHNKGDEISFEQCHVYQIL